MRDIGKLSCEERQEAGVKVDLGRMGGLEGGDLGVRRRVVEKLFAQDLCGDPVFMAR